MKKYVNPMLHVVSINKNDIIVTSFDVNSTQEISDPSMIKAPGRGMDYYEGY